MQGQAILHASVERKLAAGMRDKKKRNRESLEMILLGYNCNVLPYYLS